jgi:ABC-2 type transport system permease protein
MIELEARRMRHSGTEIIIRAVQPVLWLVVFGPIMGHLRAINTGGIPYVDFITPGILIQSSIFVAIFYGLTIVWERDSGILKKLLATPAPRYATVIGRSMASGVRAVFQGLVVIPIALIIGVSFVANPLYFIVAFLIIFFASGGFAALSIIIASFMKNRETFMGIGQAIILPLFFASNALYPTEIMPSVLRHIVTYNPLSYMVDAVRSLIITGDLHQLPIDILAIGVFDALMFGIAALTFKRIIE